MPDPQPSGAFEWAQAPWGRVLRCLPLQEIACHFFTARDLELKHDDREWAAVAAAIGVEPGRLRLTRQVHGNAVAIARASDPSAWPRPEADVVVSDDGTAAVGVRVADCAPVLIGDRVRGVVAAVHAGWRGTVKRAAAAAVAALASEYGSRPDDLVAAIGPCLGPCCGEVGSEVEAEFRAAGHSAEDVARWCTPGRPGKAHLDLPGANRDQLAAAGIPGDRIHDAGLCTKTHAARLHSYRADGTGAGRMVGVVRPRR